MAHTPHGLLLALGLGSVLWVSTMGQSYDGVVESLKVLRGCGFQPSSILDVGANMGYWTKSVKGVFPTANFFMVEGNSFHEDSLKKTGTPYSIALLGAHEGNVTFYRYPQKGVSATGNSVFMETTGVFSESMRVRLPLSTLDNLMIKNNISGTTWELAKFDIQGSELAAIRGGHITLSKTEVLVTEAPVHNYNSGAPTLLHLYHHLHGLGFSPFDCVDLSRNNKKILIQMDILWVRRSSSLWNESCTTYPRRNKMTIAEHPPHPR